MLGHYDSPGMSVKLETQPPYTPGASYMQPPPVTGEYFKNFGKDNI